MIGNWRAEETNSTNNETTTVAPNTTEANTTTTTAAPNATEAATTTTTTVTAAPVTNATTGKTTTKKSVPTKKPKALECAKLKFQVKIYIFVIKIVLINKFTGDRLLLQGAGWKHFPRFDNPTMHQGQEGSILVERLQLQFAAKFSYEQLH